MKSIFTLAFFLSAVTFALAQPPLFTADPDPMSSSFGSVSNSNGTSAMYDPDGAGPMPAVELPAMDGYTAIIRFSDQRVLASAASSNDGEITLTYNATAGDVLNIWFAVPDPMNAGAWLYYEADQNGSFTHSANFLDNVRNNLTSENTTGSSNLQALLPVEFTAFAADATSNGVSLKWTTALEMNSEVFVVERSTNGTRYTAIGEVAAAGESADERHYQFVDTDADAGLNYYRLRQIDFDGAEMFSEIVSVEVRKDLTVGVFPNPATEFVTLTSDTPFGNTAEGTLLDATGRTVRRFTLAGEQQVRIELGGLSTGTYYVRIVDGAQLRNVPVQKL